MLCLAFATMACARPMQVPEALRGNTPLVIVNDTPDDLCSFKVSQPADHGEAEEWTGFFRTVEAYSRQTFQVKPGVYLFDFRACPSYEKTLDTVRLEVPTEYWISTFRKKHPPSPGYVQFSAVVKERPRAPAAGPAAGSPEPPWQDNGHCVGYRTACSQMKDNECCPGLQCVADRNFDGHGTIMNACE